MFVLLRGKIESSCVAVELDEVELARERGGVLPPLPPGEDDRCNTFRVNNSILSALFSMQWVDAV